MTDLPALLTREIGSRLIPGCGCRATFLPLDPEQPVGRLKHLLLSFAPNLLLWASTGSVGGMGSRTQ